MGIFNINKNIGETMGEYVRRIKKEHNYNKLAFAGRLDPLAYGDVIVLTEEDIFKKDNYCNLDKLYECFIIEGIKTDTYDILGIPMNEIYTFNNFFDNVKNYNYNQEYPAYSSHKVIDLEGVKRTSWYCAKNNISISKSYKKNITLHKANKIYEFQIKPNELLELIEHKISLINKDNDFRQDIIIDNWKKYLLNYNDDIKVSKWSFTISSGGYIRYLANYMNGSCYDIHRIKYLYGS